MWSIVIEQDRNFSLSIYASRQRKERFYCIGRVGWHILNEQVEIGKYTDGCLRMESVDIVQSIIS